MSSKSGSKTSRVKVGSHRGYSIIKVTTEYYHRSLWGNYYDTNWVDKRYVHFDFCKEGEEKRPTQHYEACAKTKNDCIEAIDKFIEDDSTCFTAGEREKYVYKPNRKCEWAYGYDSLMKIMKEHQKASVNLSSSRIFMRLDAFWCSFIIFIRLS